MVRKRDFIVIAIIAILISLTGFILDLNERVPKLMTNVFEIIMMAVFMYVIISIPYFAIKLIVSKFGKPKS